jgi:myo-inositol-1(or 4)-monophosphatase
MMYVACGRAGAFFEYQLSPWDYAAASVIIEEAGGIITQMNGEPVTFDRPCSIVAGSPAVYRDLMDNDLFEL